MASLSSLSTLSTFISAIPASRSHFTCISPAKTQSASRARLAQFTLRTAKFNGLNVVAAAEGKGDGTLMTPKTCRPCFSLSPHCHRLGQPGFEQAAGFRGNEKKAKNEEKASTCSASSTFSVALISASLLLLLPPLPSFATTPMLSSPPALPQLANDSFHLSHPFYSATLGEAPAISDLLPSSTPAGNIVMGAIGSTERANLCEEPYGFLPCSTSAGGNLFLIATFGVILFQAASLISGGSELLLEVLEPGIIGGLLLPLLGALPDTLLITVSGLRGTVEEAQEEVMVGVGVLAGSCIMILSVAWAASVFVGRCDLTGPRGTAKDRTLSAPFDPLGSGVTTDQQTREGALIMLLSTLPFLIVQVPLLDGHPTEGPEAAAIGSAVALAGAVAFGVYQVLSPWLQKKKIEEARLAFVRAQALRGLSAVSFSSSSSASTSFLFTLSQDSKRGEESAREIFRRFDEDRDGYMSKPELRAMLIAIGADEERLVPEEEQVQAWISEFDLDNDLKVSEEEFVLGLQKWVRRVSEEEKGRALSTITSAASSASDGSPFWAAQFESAKEVLALMAEEDAVAEADEGHGHGGGEAGVAIMSRSQIITRASLLMLLGAAIAAAFADPMIDAIGGFSTATSIPPFFVAFVVVPFASNASELISSIVFASKRSKRSMSLTLSQVYGAITLNNTLCLGIFLLIVHARGLTWDFSSEVTVVLLTTAIVGVLASSRTTFPVWMAAPILALYPAAISGVAFLDAALGWH